MKRKFKAPRKISKGTENEEPPIKKRKIDNSVTKKLNKKTKEKSEKKGSMIKNNNVKMKKKVYFSLNI